MDILADKPALTNAETGTGNDVEKLCYWDMFDGVIERLLLEDCVPPNRNISTSILGHQDGSQTSGVDRIKIRAMNRCKGPPANVVNHHRKLSEKMRIKESSNNRMSSYARRHQHLSQLLRVPSVSRDREPVVNNSILQHNRAIKIKRLRDISDWALSDEEEDENGVVNEDNDAYSDISVNNDNTEERKDIRQSTSEPSLPRNQESMFNHIAETNKIENHSLKSVNELISSGTSLKAVTNSTVLANNVKSATLGNLASSSEMLQKGDSGDNENLIANTNKTTASSNDVVTKWLLNSGSEEGTAELSSTDAKPSISSLSYRRETDKGSCPIDDAIRAAAGLQNSYQQFRVVNGSVMESKDRNDSTDNKEVDSDKADESLKSAKSEVDSPLFAITPVIKHELVHNVTDDNNQVNIPESFQSRSQHTGDGHQVENVNNSACTSLFESTRSSRVCDASVNPVSNLSDRSIHRKKGGIRDFGYTLPSKSVMNHPSIERTSYSNMPLNQNKETDVIFDHGSKSFPRKRSAENNTFDDGSYSCTEAATFTDERIIINKGGKQTADNKHSAINADEKRHYESECEISIPDQAVSKKSRYHTNQGCSTNTYSVSDKAPTAGKGSLLIERLTDNANVHCEQTMDELEERRDSNIKVDEFKEDDPQVHGTDGVYFDPENVGLAPKEYAVSRNTNTPNMLNDEANSGKAGPLLTMEEGIHSVVGKYKRTVVAGDLDEDEIKSILNTLLRAQRNFKNVVPSINPEEFQRKLAQYMERKNAGLGVHDVTLTEEEARKCIFLEHLLKYFEKKIGEIVKFAKCIPGFRELSMDDQANLIKVSRTESGLVGGFPGVDTEKNEVRSEKSVFSMQDVGTFISPEFLVEFKKISKKVKDAGITEKEAALLRGIIITFTDRCHLDDAEHVQTIQNKLVTCLQYVLEREVKDTSPEVRLGQLLHVLTSLRNYTDVDSKILQETLKNYPNLSSNDLVNEFLGPC